MDEQTLKLALEKGDGNVLLHRVIDDLLNGKPIDPKLAAWLALKLIEIQDYSHPKTALNARKLFGLTTRGSPKNSHGSARCTTVQMLALYELLHRRLDKSSAAESAVAKACGLKNSESPTSLFNAAGLSANGMRDLDNELLEGIAGKDLISKLT